MPPLADKASSSSVIEPSQEQVSGFSLLGARERQILQLLAEGNTSLEIARKLHLATTTVDNERRNIVKKLDVHSVAELTEVTIGQGLASLDG